MANLVNDRNELTFGGLIEAVQQIEDQASLSLSMYSRRAIITSRVYIDNSLSDEEIMGPLMMNLMNIYVGFIMTSVNMNNQVTKTKRVRDMMSIVATESIDKSTVDITDKLDKYFLGSQPQLLSSFAKNTIIGTEHSIDVLNEEQHQEYMTPSPVEGPMGSSVINPEPKDVTLPSGRIIEVSFGSDKNPNAFKVNLFLQLNPIFIPANVATQFIGLNFSPSIRQRWLQASAGEISFIKDFMLGLDQRKAHMNALKKDKSGALRDMIERQENALQNAWLKYLFITPDRQNIANTILIFEKHTFDKACSTAGLKFTDFNRRQQFFNKSFSMIVCTVDPMYNKVQMFYNGLTNTSSFTFDQLKKNSKTEAMDLMTLMRDFSKGASPKF